MARQSSQTALTAAAARAAHLIVDDEPVIFADTLAADLLGDQAEELIRYHKSHGSHLVLATARAQVTCRSRYAEESLDNALKRGITQYVILGAGLDSFAYRSALAGRLAVFEADHPATQEWKRQRLRAAGVTVPEDVRFVPIDLEAESLASKLASSGFDASEPAFVSWLGVTMYLTSDAIDAVLDEVGKSAPGTELVLDYMLPAELRDDIGNSYVDQVAPAAAERGEPWLTFFTPEQMSALLQRLRFGSVRHIAQQDIGAEAMWRRSDALAPASLSNLAHATLSG
jgi:methyltransferase (TIGR00027 family)